MSIMKIKKKREILIISSVSPYQSAGLGLDVMNSLKAIGYDVDFLTRYPTSEDSSIISVFSKKPVVRDHKNKSIWKRFFSHLSFKKKNKFVIVNLDESKPEVDTSLLLEKINKPYHLVIILFWQGMLSAGSLQAVYNKLKVPLFILAVDMFPFTGGCFYFWDCRKFIDSECCQCPGIVSKRRKKIAQKNFLYKQLIYQNTPCVFMGNSWMMSFMKQTPIIGASSIEKNLLVINENIFKIREKETLRKEFEISNDDFVIFAGAPNVTEERKGFHLLVEAMNKFVKLLTEGQKDEIILLLAGNVSPKIISYFDVKVKVLGFLDYERLPKTYSLSDIYVSPSIEDAGPSMVNQAIMSGTPVVAFNVGVAQDIVTTGKTGYRAELENSDDLAKGIKWFYDLTFEERADFQQTCRECALSLYSYDAFANNILKCDKRYVSSGID